MPVNPVYSPAPATDVPGTAVAAADETGSCGVVRQGFNHLQSDHRFLSLGAMLKNFQQ